jgi:hypothetical protein
VKPLEPCASCGIVATRTSGAPLARPPWECRRLGTRGCRRLPAQGPHCRSPSVSRSRRHRATDLGTAATTLDQGTTTTARPGRGAAAAACYWATAAVARAWVGTVTNKSGWGVKNRTLTPESYFIDRRPDLVRLVTHTHTHIYIYIHTHVSYIFVLTKS